MDKVELSGDVATTLFQYASYAQEHINQNIIFIITYYKIYIYLEVYISENNFIC